MALNIKNREVEELAAQVASMADETKTEAIRRALEERKIRLQAHGVKPKRDIRKYLEEHVWPFIPPDVMGTTITKEERERLLGYGPDGLPE
jgi:antitoxin VapB